MKRKIVHRISKRNLNNLPQLSKVIEIESKVTFMLLLLIIKQFECPYPSIIV